MSIVVVWLRLARAHGWIALFKVAILGPGQLLLSKGVIWRCGSMIAIHILRYGRYNVHNYFVTLIVA